jgi:hypothetical protein
MAAVSLIDAGALDLAARDPFGADASACSRTGTIGKAANFDFRHAEVRILPPQPRILPILPRIFGFGNRWNSQLRRCTRLPWESFANPKALGSRDCFEDLL